MYFRFISPTTVVLLFGALAGLGNCTSRENDQVIAALIRLGPAATSFCSSFLGIPKKTVTARTITPTVTATTIITTTTTIRVDKRAPTPDARNCPVFGLPCLNAKRTINRPLPGGLLPFREALISIGCSLLHITPAVTTITATAPATTTTTSTTTTLVTTVHRSNCDPDASHNTSGNGFGNSIIFTADTSSFTCCQACQATLNCVASAFVSAGGCQTLIRTSPVAGTQITPMCPLGAESYPFGPSVTGALVFRGPCGLGM